MSFEKRESLFYRYEKSFHEIIYVNPIGFLKLPPLLNRGHMKIAKFGCTTRS